MIANRFATAINCIDGRVQIPVRDWIKAHHPVDYVDMITEPGPERQLAESNQAIVESIKRRLEISLTRHNSTLVAIAGHHDCAGNPADEVTQTRQIIAALDVITSWGLGIPVIGLRVDEFRRARQVGGPESGNKPGGHL
ncbi:MAG: hypothetical protein HYX91_03910 [Chloroflexi bacterium]|nr:hypothetical protein [Chloroflexota bacterium]